MVRLFLFAMVGLLSAQESARVARHNQVGYLPKASKQLVVATSDSGPVCIQDLIRGGCVLNLPLDSVKVWAASGDTVRRVDWSGVQKPGLYGAF